MRQLERFSIALFIMFALGSCSSDDDSLDNPGIVGTWRLTSLTLENNYDFNGDGTAVENVLIETGCNQEQFVVFNNDNTGALINQTFLLSVSEDQVSPNNYEYLIECDPTNISVGFSWLQEGSEITITNLFGSDTFTLVGSDLINTVEDAWDVPVIENNELLGFNLENTTLVYNKQ